MKTILVLLACLLLCGCGIVTAVLRGIGVPVPEEASGASKVVDEAIQNWLWTWFGWGSGIATSEGARGAVKAGKVIVRKRREKKAAARGPISVPPVQ